MHTQNWNTILDQFILDCIKKSILIVMFEGLCRKFTKMQIILVFDWFWAGMWHCLFIYCKHMSLLVMYGFSYCTKGRTPSINAQCRSMPLKIVAFDPKSRVYIHEIGAERERRNRWMPINSDQFCSIPINSSQCQTTKIQAMPWFWSALRGISDQCHDFDRHWSALGIDPRSPGLLLQLRCSDALRGNLSRQKPAQ